MQPKFFLLEQNNEPPAPPDVVAQGSLQTVLTAAKDFDPGCYNQTWWITIQLQQQVAYTLPANMPEHILPQGQLE